MFLQNENPCTRREKTQLADTRRGCIFLTMPIRHLDPLLAEELRQLYAALPEVAGKALAALKVQPNRVLEGPALARFKVEDAKLSALFRRIKEIHALTGEPWDA